MQNKQRSKTESERLHREYIVYIQELRRLIAEKHGEQLCFEFMKEENALTKSD